MTDNPRGTGPNANTNTMPARKIKLNRVYPDRPSLVDSGSDRLGMVRQSPARYELVLDKSGVNIVNSETKEKVDSVTAAKITDGILATQLANKRMEKMSQSDFTGIPRVSGEDVTRRLREKTMPENMYVTKDKKGPVTYTSLRGYSDPTVRNANRVSPNVYGNLRKGMLNQKDRDAYTTNETILREGEYGSGGAYAGDPEFDIMMTPPGGGMAYGGIPSKKKKKRKMRHGGKMKKYAKGGGIRKPKYS